MPSSLSRKPPILRQFAGLWTMTDHKNGKKAWSQEEKFRRAKQSGFDGLGGGPLPEVPSLRAKYNLDYICYIDGNEKTYRANLEKAKAVAPSRVNVQLCNHDTPPKEAAKVWVKMEALAEKMGLQADLEVHRDTCTETPEKTYEIAALYQKATGRKIRLSWDFSHLAVVKHLLPPFAERLLVRPDLIQLSRQMHFRPFNGHHAQIPATDGRGNEIPEFRTYLKFLDALLACWFKGAKGGEVLYVCPEFGPVSSGYGVSSFADVWKDAIRLRRKTEALWKSNLRKWQAR